MSLREGYIICEFCNKEAYGPHSSICKDCRGILDTLPINFVDALFKLGNRIEELEKKVNTMS